MRNFRGFKRDKSWRRHQKHDNVNKEDKSRWDVRDFRDSDDVRYRRRQLQEMGLHPPSIVVSHALWYLRGLPGTELDMGERVGDATMGDIVDALTELITCSDVPRATRRDSRHWKETKSKDKARKSARRDKTLLTYETM